MSINLQKLLIKTKKAQRNLSIISNSQKKKVLVSLCKIIKDRKDEVFIENKKDIENAEKKGKNAAFIDRLTFTQKNFTAMLDGLTQIAGLESALGETIERRTLENGVKLQKIRVPLGVIGIIYESRPNITIEVFALCFQSGNACVLKGGSDAINSNRILFDCIRQALSLHKLNKDIALFLDTTDRSIVSTLLKQRDFIDVIIPRGGYELVKKVVEESTIPVLYHSEGGARIYVDSSADLDLALKICLNAKTSRPATCNSLDTLLVNEKIADKFLPELFIELGKNNVELRLDEKAQNEKLKMRNNSLKYKKAIEEDFKTEFLDYILAVKIVKNVDEAIGFIQKYSKKHSEGIIAEDKSVIAKFTSSIDAAALFINCSTRLHDGGVMGFGAEMGIATGKLHARGPVGIKELTTYKWIAYGEGQIRT